LLFYYTELHRGHTEEHREKLIKLCKFFLCEALCFSGFPQCKFLVFAVNGF
jgi:hypothetical protein